MLKQTTNCTPLSSSNRPSSIARDSGWHSHGIVTHEDAERGVDEIGGGYFEKTLPGHAARAIELDMLKEDGLAESKLVKM